MLKAEHKLAMEVQQSSLHRLQTTLTQLKRDEMSITAAVGEAQRRIAEAHDAFTGALAPTQPGQGSATDNDASMDTAVIPGKTPKMPAPRIVQQPKPVSMPEFSARR